MTDLDATAEALAQDSAPTPETPPADSAPTEPTPELTEDEILDRAYDKAAADGVEEEEEAPPEDEQPEAEVEEAPEEAPAEDAPSFLPRSVRDKWDGMQPDVREAVAEAHKEMSAKLAEQGRQVHGIAPIKDKIIEASKEFPALMDMKPDEIAGEVFELARISAQFKTNPVQTIVGLIDQHGMRAHVAQALGQEVPENAPSTEAMERKIATLEEKLARATDPSRFNEIIETHSAQQAAHDEVQKFAATAEHWDAVETTLPGFIPAAKSVLGESASAKDVLELAYNLNVQANPHLTPKATPEPVAGKAPAQVDPERIKAAQKAKSVNVTSRGTGKQRELTEDEILDRAYDLAASK